MNAVLRFNARKSGYRNEMNFILPEEMETAEKMAQLLADKGHKDVTLIAHSFKRQRKTGNKVRVEVVRQFRSFGAY